MKIIFSPEHQDHLFLGLNETNDHLMDTMVCDTIGLVGMLELRLGLYVEPHPAHYRTVRYYKAMSEYMKRHPDNILAASFRLSSLGTAEQALRWRDNLMLDRWQPEETSSGSGRLDVLAGTEQFFDSPGLPDQLWSVIESLRKERADFLKDVEVELPCSPHLLHPAIRQLLSVMETCGAKTSLRSWESHTRKSNLAEIAHLLQSDSQTQVTLDKEDRSFLIYCFHDEKEANEYMALKGGDLHADVWINHSNKTMDNWLRMMGQPTMGSHMAEAAPQLLQLFVLSIDMMKEPLNIQSLISWLYSPIQPLGTFFGGILADTIIAEGGYRNKKCQQVVADYIAGKYTYHDLEEEAKLSEEEKRKRQAREEKKRRTLTETYLPPFEAEKADSISTLRLKIRLNSLANWARTRAHLLRDQPANEGWCSQLEVLAQMCDTFVMLTDASDMGETVDFRQTDSWLSTLFKGESFLQYYPQKGSRQLIDSPAKMAARSRRTVWMNFSGEQAPHLDGSFLYHSEKERIKDSITLWEEQEETSYHQMMGLLPFVMTDEQLILVVTDYTAGEPTPKHPVLVRLESQLENLRDFMESPTLLDEKMTDVGIVSNTNTTPLISFQHPELIRWPNHLSPTIISTLVEYPFDYMMERLLGIVGTGPGSISDLKTTMGTVAHAVIESLFAPRDGHPCSEADEIAQRISSEFDEQLRRQIEACGAILYLPENRLDAELLKEQLHRCIHVLLEIIRDNRLVVTGCEHKVTEDMKLIDNDKGWDMIGFIDMTLEDEHHHPVVFDFKWTSSKSYHRELLQANRSTQLELYRAMLSAEKHRDVQRTAYFLMPEGHLYSKEHFEGRHCTQISADNAEDIVEQLRQSFFYRKSQLDSGHVEVSEGFPLGELDYFRDTEPKNLFPLASDETGTAKENIFSKYQLFK